LACTGYPKCRFTKPLGHDQETTGEEQKETGEVCDKCGRPMAFRRGRFGEFLGCSGYPECKNTKPLASKEKGTEKTSDEKCEKCSEFLVIKRNRYGKPFLACPNYPKCTFATSFKKRTEDK